MNTDADELTVKRRKTARVVCIVAAVLVLLPCLGFNWMRAPRGADAGISLVFTSSGDESESNLNVVDMYNQYRSESDQILGTFAYAGIATLFFSVIAAGALAAAGGLAFKDKFIRTPIPLTTVALLALCLSLVSGCVFLGAIPKDIMSGGVGWPFFLYGAGVVTGLAGAQMLGKAYSEVRDPYWDGLDQTPGA
ncbi:MAG: hypothetical protein K8M05_15135 [Deltaproteobacteria bacterium]|nr:hypothetical protein [Kofleriaceae bacterium]